jgi:hypothetical protein
MALAEDAKLRFERQDLALDALASALEDQGVTALVNGARAEAITSFDRALELTAETGAICDPTRLRGRLRDCPRTR